MVAMVEIVFLIVCAVLGLWWFSRTSTFRAHRRSGVDPDWRPQTDRERQEGTGSPGGFSPDLPSHKFPRPGS
jgi:hypothetical protein